MGNYLTLRDGLGIISRNIMSKFSSSHPLCRFCLFSSTFMSGDQLPRVGHGICGFGAAAVSRQCAPMRSVFEEVENLFGDFALYFGTLCTIALVEVCIRLFRGRGVDKKLVW